MQKIFGLISSLLGSKNFYLAIAIIFLLVCVWTDGYRTGSDAIKKEIVEQNQKILETKNEQLRVIQVKVDEAIKERDKALNSAANLRRDNDRLVSRLRVSEADRGAGNGVCTVGSDGRRLRECRNLLAETLELAGEGEELARRFNADRKALEKIKK